MQSSKIQSTPKDSSVPPPKSPQSDLGHTVLTIIFPPAGLYFAWRQKTLDQVLPKFVLTYSCIFFLLSLPIYGAPLTLSSFDKSFTSLSTPIFIAVTTLLGVCILGIIMGYLHMRHVKRYHSITRSDKIFLFALITGIMLFNALLSLYITTLTANLLYTQLNAISF